jgi:hypothetical protein
MEMGEMVFVYVSIVAVLAIAVLFLVSAIKKDDDVSGE